MCVTNWIDCVLTFGIVFFACLQWICSDKQRNTELFKFRITHIQDLKNFWDSFHKNIEYIPQVKSEYTITQDYLKQRYEIFKFLDEHADFTQCYFNKNVYNQELDFIDKLSKILPQSNIDATTYKIDLRDFESVENCYNSLLKAFLKIIN